MRKIFTLAFIFAPSFLLAQNYTRDAGLRFGEFFTATYRQYQEDDQALEGMLNLGRRGMTATVLKEYFKPLPGRGYDNLFFTCGFGAHAGFRSVNRYRVLNRTYVLEENRVTPLIGIDGMIGLEYRFAEFPFVLGLDVKPYFEYSVVQIFSLYLHSFGISLKYKF